MKSIKMYDLTKCSGNNCAKKQKCKRYTSSKGARQWRTDFSESIKNGECDYFLKN